MEIGYIIVPENTNREEYVKSCFVKQSFYVLTNDGGVIPDVLCLEQILNKIKIPNTSKELGTQVLIEKIEKYNQNIIIGTLSKQGISNYQSEFDLNQSKDNEGNSLGIVGNTFLSNLKIFVKNVFNKISKLIISVEGNEDSELNLNSSGWIFCNSKKGIKLIKNKKQIIINEEGIFINNQEGQGILIDDDNFYYVDKFKNKFIIDKEGYKIGNINFKEYIQKILDFLGNNLILNTPCGPSGPGCMSTASSFQLQQLKTELNNINK